MVWQFLFLLLITMVVGSYTHCNTLRNDKANLVVDTGNILANGVNLLDMRLGDLRDQMIHFQRVEIVIDIWNMKQPFEERSHITMAD